jgi:ABC-type nitrate/sulfonate/bicarbonate transport system substrate-binding protein
MHTRRFWATRFIGAAIMVLAAGCASAGGNAALTATAPQPEEPDITVAAIPAVDLAGLYIALDEGLFAQQGLHVTVVKIPSSQAVVADQLKGRVDISAGSYVMPRHLHDGDWSAAFLSEPYVTAAGEQYGEQALADLDQGAALNLPIDGYVATQAWAQQHPKTAAAFTRAIQQGQAIANRNAAAVQTAMARYDDLPPQVTAAIAQTGYPVGPVVEASIQRVAIAMLKFGLLGPQAATAVEQQTLASSMVGISGDSMSHA